MGPRTVNPGEAENRMVLDDPDPEEAVEPAEPEWDEVLTEEEIGYD